MSTPRSIPDIVLDRYLAGDLSEQQCGEIEAMLASSAELRTHVATCRAQREAFLAQDPPERFAARLAAKADFELRSHSPRFAHWRSWLVPAGALAVGVVAVVVAQSDWRQLSSTSVYRPEGAPLSSAAPGNSKQPDDVARLSAPAPSSDVPQRSRGERIALRKNRQAPVKRLPVASVPDGQSEVGGGWRRQGQEEPSFGVPATSAKSAQPLSEVPKRDEGSDRREVSSSQSAPAAAVEAPSRPSVGEKAVMEASSDAVDGEAKPSENAAGGGSFARAAGAEGDKKNEEADVMADARGGLTNAQVVMAVRAQRSLVLTMWRQEMPAQQRLRLRIEIDGQGVVRAVFVLTPDAKEDLSRRVKDAIGKWRFPPGADGNPTTTSVVLSSPRT